MEGDAPRTCEPWICRRIVDMHLRSPAMLAILPLQDWLATDAALRSPHADRERINIPAAPRYYWRYRMHLTLVLADEPTGALDSKAAQELLRLFSSVNHDGQTILMVTHSVKAASSANRVMFIKDGEVFHQLYRGNLTDEQMYQKISDTLTVLEAGGERVE